MRAAVVQMASGSVPRGNQIEAEKHIRAAAEAGAELVVLPENFGVITAHERDIVAYGEEPARGPLQDFLAGLAADLSVIIVGGTIPLQASSADKVRDGQCIARYDKIHLFDVALPNRDEQYHESSIIEPGDKVVVIEVDGINLGLAICYDLRFPELFRLLVEKGADVIAMPAAFTATTGKAHWHSLVRARAIENLCYILAAAQGGYHVNGRETYGHSLIVDPWGNTLDEVASGAGFALAEINLNQQQEIRARFPVLTHRKIAHS